MTSKGRNSKKVDRRTDATDEREALAELAIRDYNARRSPAHRALQLQRINRWSHIVGAGLMLALGSYSAVGVHEFVAKGYPQYSVEWWFGWGLEYAILGAVALIALARGMLALSGARLRKRVWVLEFGLLSFSVAANWSTLPADADTARTIMRMAGPLGCLALSWALSEIEHAIHHADVDTGQIPDTTMSGQALERVRGQLSQLTVNGLSKLSAFGAGSKDSTVRDEVSATATSTDESGQQNADSKDQANADTNADTTELSAITDTGTVRKIGAKYADALARARELGADTVLELSVREAADALGCGRTTAGHVQKTLRDERDGQPDTDTDTTADPTTEEEAKEA